jgi:tartrate-resistant acid phosphatase type 5
MSVCFFTAEVRVKSLSLGLLTFWLFSAQAQTPWTRFAIIGDFGTDDANELAVSELVKTNLQPDFILTVGDNQYDGATAYDRDVGKYYHDYIGNYSGAYGIGAVTNRFWPALGNHDYLADDYAAYTAYFILPGNERYYDIVRGPAHFFICNSDSNEPDGTSANSVQALWLSNQLARSTSTWNIVLLHHPPYSSSGSMPGLQWPFREWGADAVIAGHVHSYERLQVSGFPYIVNGAGGASIEGAPPPIPESQVQYNTANGAMLGQANGSLLELSFYSVAGGGTIIDTLTLTNRASPKLEIKHLVGKTNQISWSTNFKGFVVDSTASLQAGHTWAQVPQTPAIQGSFYTIRIPSTNSAAYYRLRGPVGP